MSLVFTLLDFGVIYCYRRMPQDEHLEWMSDGRELWNNIVDLQPAILTGLPMGKWAEPQKVGVWDRFVLRFRPIVRILYSQYSSNTWILPFRIFSASFLRQLGSALMMFRLLFSSVCILKAYAPKWWVMTGLFPLSWQRKWCLRELGHVPVITCMSRDKHLHCTPGSVLIDDR